MSYVNYFECTWYRINIIYKLMFIITHACFLKDLGNMFTFEIVGDYFDLIVLHNSLKQL